MGIISWFRGLGSPDTPHEGYDIIDGEVILDDPPHEGISVVVHSLIKLLRECPERFEVSPSITKRDQNTGTFRLVDMETGFDLTYDYFPVLGIGVDERGDYTWITTTEIKYIHKEVVKILTEEFDKEREALEDWETLNKLKARNKWEDIYCKEISDD